MSQPFSDEQIAKLKKFCEHEGLEEFLPYAKFAAAEAKISSARRLVWKSYRQIFIGTVGLLVAVATFWEKTTAGLKSLLLGVLGQ